MLHTPAHQVMALAPNNPQRQDLPCKRLAHRALESWKLDTAVLRYNISGSSLSCSDSTDVAPDFVKA